MSIDVLHNLANQNNFSLNDNLFIENWDYLTQNNKLFDSELVNLRLVEHVGSSDETIIMKEFGSSSILDNHRNYEFDGNIIYYF